MAKTDITVTRIVVIQLDAPGTLQGLVTELNGLIAKPAIGPDAVIQRLQGGGQAYDLVVLKPETP
jgi:hypothetical protein